MSGTHGMVRRLLITTGVVLVALSVGSPATRAASITYRVASNAPATVAVGTPVVVEVRAAFDTPLAAAAYSLSATGDGAVRVESRNAAAGLTWLGTDPQAPLADELPRALSDAPLREVLVWLDAEAPGGADDGVAPGGDVLLIGYVVTPQRQGAVTITLQDVAAAHTQGAVDGSLFDSVAVDPTGASLSFNVVVDADLDDDHDVDLRDAAIFQACFPEGNGIPACAAADIDGDGDVTLADFGLLADCLTGPSVAACGAGSTEVQP